MNEDSEAKARANGTFRAPGYVILDAEGYDLPLALASVKPGWAQLLQPLFEGKPEGVRVVQVKEKFGGLRVYLEADPGTDPFVYQMYSKQVAQAEGRSYALCELCGEPGFPRSGGWVRTLCDVHGEGKAPWRMGVRPNALQA